MANQSFEILSILTLEAKKRIANMFVTGKSFKVDTFRVGDGGFDPADNTIPLTPDENATDVYGTPGGTFTGQILPENIFFQTPVCPVFQCVLLPGQATGPIGSIGLYGTIVYSPLLGDPELGKKFLFAIATRPIYVKVANEKIQFNLSVIGG